MDKTHIYNNSIVSRAIVLLDSYYDQLSQDIDNNGYCTEYLGQSDEYKNTRLLCQTRCMYFLTEYSLCRDDTKALNQALILFHLIKNDYYDSVNKHWLQYPNREKLDNLYEYAFLIFSISKLYSVIKHDEHYKQDLEALNNYVTEKYFHPESQFKNLAGHNGLVSQNALMHLYESYLELYKVVPEKRYFEVLDELLSSAKLMFFDKGVSLISEYSPFGDENTIYEPGHSFEWACLLLESEQMGLKFKDKIFYADLAQSAEKYGVMSQGVVKQSISNLNDKDRYRIWPMLERMRYYLISKNIEKINKIFSEFDNIFINPYTKLPIEYVDSELSKNFEGVKTTTSYHLINCLKHFI